MRKQGAIVAVIAIIAMIVVIYYAWNVLNPEGISSAEATEIVIEKIAEPSEAVYGLRVYRYSELLSNGSTVVPFVSWVKGEKEFIVCDGDCWLFWFDDNPLAQFGHETRYVLVDAVTGETMTREAEWWPVINDTVVWGTTDERVSDEFIVYEKPFEFELPIDWEHDFSLLQAQGGCEPWAILVCGSDDVGNTFDEDVRYVYNVLTGLGYTDDHIFYLSPWTADPGVDRVTSVTNVQWAINQVAANSDVEDKVFFFYSSHGGVDSLNCYPGSPGGGFVSSANMDNWLDTITSREIVIMLQGCHTGSFIGAYSDGTVVASENELTGDGETNRIVITATDTTHPSWGGPSNWGSTFTGGYAAAFSATTADVDSNGAISVNEAYTYACDHDSAALDGLSFPQIDPTSLDPANAYHTCMLPDLVVESLTHSPSTPTTADQITFTVVIKNDGAESAGPSTLSFRVGGETYAEEFSIPSLAPGETYTVQRQEVLTVAQSYQNTITVDVNNDVPESNEGNNVQTYSYTVTQYLP